MYVRLLLDQELISLLLILMFLFFFFLLLGRPHQKSRKLHRLGWDEVWHDCSSSKCAFIGKQCPDDVVQTYHHSVLPVIARTLNVTTLSKSFLTESVLTSLSCSATESAKK